MESHTEIGICLLKWQKRVEKLRKKTSKPKNQSEIKPEEIEFNKYKFMSKETQVQSMASDIS